MSATNPSANQLDDRTPEQWWRTLSEVVVEKRRGPRIVVSGDLHHDPSRAQCQVRDWQAHSITPILDVRGEYSDRDLVEQYAPEITYIECGTHDDGVFGVRQDRAWFDEALEALGATPADRDAVALVHCHMGVNRAPSMALRLLLEQGMAVIPALDAIRAARPIAAIAYAEEAVDHWLAGEQDDEVIAFAEAMVLTWHDANPIDVSWVISRIRVAGTRLIGRPGWRTHATRERPRPPLTTTSSRWDRRSSSRSPSIRACV